MVLWTGGVPQWSSKTGEVPRWSSKQVGSPSGLLNTIAYRIQNYSGIVRYQINYGIRYRRNNGIVRYQKKFWYGKVSKKLWYRKVFNKFKYRKISNKSWYCLFQSVGNAHKDWICGLALLPATNCLLSGCRGGVIKLWNIDNCQQVGEMTAHTSPINSITTNSTLVFTASK